MFPTSPTDYLLAGATLHFWQGQGSPSVACPFSGKKPCFFFIRFTHVVICGEISFKRAEP
jgi:hypothetical protein